MSTSESFAPFSFDDDEGEDRSSNESDKILTRKPAVANNHYATGLSASHSCTTATSKTNNTSKKLRDPPTSRMVALPPRLNVKLALHEEVSSTAILDEDNNGDLSTSHLFVEGKITAQVSSSDASKNAPFCLHVSGAMISAADITYSNYCTPVNNRRNEYSYGSEIEGSMKYEVNIPKSKVERCEVISYTIDAKTHNMPILVQPKALLNNQNKCRISVQIRSNLGNHGDLANFMIVVAIPNTVQGSTLQVTRGPGTYDNIKRIVTWKIGNLAKGKSNLVSVEAELSSAVAKLLVDKKSTLKDAVIATTNNKIIQEKVTFPVLVRCSSDLDQISDLSLDAMDLDSVPASIVLQQTRSFRLLHRVGK
mmetsp:Transcript_22326/g.45932  ORF Transcript_22326/g.45932 Transcript_22326/m.45932 type:complete len:365 (-) Transcript_22326:202-1296(-)